MSTPKGTIPWNTGKKCDYLLGNNHAVGNGPNQTSFKKGRPAHNKKIRLPSPCACGCGQTANPGRQFVLWHQGRVSGFQVGERHWNWKGGTLRGKYPYQWKQISQSILKRDGYACRLCKSYINLQVHHRDVNPENNNRRNLITLCTSCHGLTHAALRRAEGRIT